MNLWAIQHNNGLYWNNELGWVSEDTAELFSDKEHQHLINHGDLPAPVNSCKWVKFDRPLSEKQLLFLFRYQIYDCADIIDPGDSMDWVALAAGFFLGLGVPAEQATNYALCSAASCGLLEKS